MLTTLKMFSSSEWNHEEIYGNSENSNNVKYSWNNEKLLVKISEIVDFQKNIRKHISYLFHCFTCRFSSSSYSVARSIIFCIYMPVNGGWGCNFPFTLPLKWLICFLRRKTFTIIRTNIRLMMERRWGGKIRKYYWMEKCFYGFSHACNKTATRKVWVESNLRELSWIFMLHNRRWFVEKGKHCKLEHSTTPNTLIPHYKCYITCNRITWLTILSNQMSERISLQCHRLTSFYSSIIHGRKLFPCSVVW